MAKTTAKKKAWGWCSKYIRLRDSIEYCKEHGMHPDSGWAQCCSCQTVKQWKQMDAGHYYSRGLGGSSGVYFDERNIHAQCKQCNGFKQGNAQAYREFMLNRYGQEVLDELMVKDKISSYKGQIPFVGEMYKQMFEKLKELKGE